MSTTTTFKTSGTHCPSCSMLIQMNVGDLDGVEEVTADHAKETATVVYDETRVTTDRIIAEIEAAGYGAQVVH